MDPDKCLSELRAAIHALLNAESDNASYDAAVEIAERFADLDEWMACGGFIPTAWNALRAA